jgi:hypothetical protein
MAEEPPAARYRLGQQHPGALREGVVAGRSPAQLREPLDDGDLLIAVERAGVREDLHADVIALAVDVREAPEGSSWMKAAVFFRNNGISGTFSIFISASASCCASACRSAKVPLGA